MARIQFQPRARDKALWQDGSRRRHTNQRRESHHPAATSRAATQSSKCKAGRSYCSDPFFRCQIDIRELSSDLMRAGVNDRADVLAA